MKEGQTQEPVGGMLEKIATILYANKSDEGDEGSWINSEDFYRVAEKIEKMFTPPPAPIKTEGEDEKISLFQTYKEALETIANDEGACCQRCEGNGRLWADGQAHYPSYEGPTIPCGNCGGEGRIYEDIKQIAIDALNHPAPPSPVGIDVEDLAKEYADDIWESIPMEVQYIYLNLISAFKAGYEVSLPQSNNEFDELKSFLSKKAKDLNIYVDFSDKNYDGDKSAPMDLFGFVEHIFNQLPQSSTEEEDYSL